MRPATSLDRNEQRQATVRGLHGFVSEANGAALDHGVGQLSVAGKVEIGEHQLALANQGIFRSDRLFHLNNHFGTFVHVLDGGEDFRADSFVHLIGETAAFTGGVLHIDGVAVLDQFGNARGGHAHAILIVLNLFWNTNFHFSIVLLVNGYVNDASKV